MFSMDVGAVGLPVWDLLEDMSYISDDAQKFSINVETAAFSVMGNADFVEAVRDTQPQVYREMKKALYNPSTGRWTWRVSCSCECMFGQMESTKRAMCRTCIRPTIDIVNDARVRRGLAPLYFTSVTRDADGTIVDRKVIKHDKSMKLSHILPPNERVVLSDERGRDYDMVVCLHPSINPLETSETMQMRRLQGLDLDHINCRDCYYNNASLPRPAGNSVGSSPFQGDGLVNVCHPRTVQFFPQQAFLALGSLFMCGKCRPHWAILSRGFVRGFIKRSLLLPVIPADIGMACTYDSPLLTPDGQYQVFSVRRDENGRELPIARRPIDAIMSENVARFARRKFGAQALASSSSGSDNSGEGDAPAAMDEPFVFMNNVAPSAAREFREEVISIIDSRLSTGPIMAGFVHDIRCLIELSKFVPRKEGEKFAPHRQMTTALARRLVTAKGDVPATFAVLIALASCINVPLDYYPADYMSKTDEEASRSYAASVRAFARGIIKEQLGKVSDESGDHLRRLEALLIQLEEEHCGPEASYGSETMGAKRAALRAFAESVTNVADASPTYDSIVSFIWPFPAGVNEVYFLVEAELDWYREFHKPEILFRRLLRSHHDARLIEGTALNDAMNIYAEYDAVTAGGTARTATGRPVAMPQEWIDRYVILTARHYAALIIR